MKKLEVTFNFITPDDAPLDEAQDLVNYTIDCIWDIWHNINYRLNNYKIGYIEITPNIFGEPSCKNIDVYKYYNEMNEKNNNITS